MTNEEKILEILGVIQGDMADMKNDLKGLHAEMREVKDDIKGLHAHVARMEKDLTRVLAHDRRFNALKEGNELLLQTLAHKEDVEDDVGLLRAVIKEHSRQIAALKRAL